MIRIAEKHGFMKTRAVKVWTQAGISGSMGPANIAFCIDMQENHIGKEKYG